MFSVCQLDSRCNQSQSLRSLCYLSAFLVQELVTVCFLVSSIITEGKFGYPRENYCKLKLRVVLIINVNLIHLTRLGGALYKSQNSRRVKGLYAYLAFH